MSQPPLVSIPHTPGLPAIFRSGGQMKLDADLLAWLVRRGINGAEMGRWPLMDHAYPGEFLGWVERSGKVKLVDGQRFTDVDEAAETLRLAKTWAPRLAGE